MISTVSISITSINAIIISSSSCCCCSCSCSSSSIVIMIIISMISTIVVIIDKAYYRAFATEIVQGSIYLTSKYEAGDKVKETPSYN